MIERKNLYSIIGGFTFLAQIFLSPLYPGVVNIFFIMLFVLFGQQGKTKFVLSRNKSYILFMWLLICFNAFFITAIFFKIFPYVGFYFLITTISIIYVSVINSN